MPIATLEWSKCHLTTRLVPQAKCIRSTLDFGKSNNLVYLYCCKGKIILWEFHIMFWFSYCIGSSTYFHMQLVLKTNWNHNTKWSVYCLFLSYPTCGFTYLPTYCCIEPKFLLFHNIINDYTEWNSSSSSFNMIF